METRLLQYKVLFYLISIVQVCQAFNVYTYTTQAVEMKEKTHALHYKSEFYDFISKTFRLRNGNTVQCKIPIYSTLNSNFLPTLEEEFRSAHILNKTKLQVSAAPSMSISQEESDRILQSLQNQCTEYRTSSFLWQFCYKKYLRQFDDILTVGGASKNKFEDIYVGYYPYYNNKTNMTQMDYKQEFNAQNYFQIDNFYYEQSIQYANRIYTINPHIKKANLTDSTFIQIQGKVIQFQRFNTSLFTQSNIISIEFTTKTKIAASHLSDSLIELSLDNNTIDSSSTTSSSKKSRIEHSKTPHSDIAHANRTATNDTFGYRLILHTIIDKHFGLAQDEFPQDIEVDKFEVIVFTGSATPRNNDFLTLYDGRQIYGKRLNALKQLSRDDLIIVQLYNQVVIKKVKRVWHHSLVELYEDSQGHELKNKDLYIQSIQVLGRKKQYKVDKSELSAQFVGLYDNYFDISTYNRKVKYISGKFLIDFSYLSAAAGDTLLFIAKDTYIVSMIVNVQGGIIQLDTELDNFNGFIVKANSIQHKQNYFDYYPQNRNVQDHKVVLHQHQQQSSRPVNKKKQMLFKSKQFPRILSFKSIKDETSNDPNLLPFTDLEGFQFSDEDLTKQRFMNFIIQRPLLQDEFAQLKLVITDSLEYVEQAVEIIFTYDNQILAYDVFDKKNIISKNKKYENTTLTDTTIWILIDRDNTVRLGFSNVISPSTQVLSLKTKYTSLKNFRFLTQHTVNYYLLFTYLDVIEKPIDFSILNPNVLLYENQTIKQKYLDGDICQVINGPRTFTVEYICGESLFSILSVTEPSVCQYHLQVETYLLCQKQLSTYHIPPPPKDIYCILQNSIQ